MVKRILVLTSGSKRKITPFVLAAKKTQIALTTASFDDIVFGSGNEGLYLKSGEDIADFALIYFRLVGKSLETASLVAEHAKKKGIKIIDKIYTNSQVFPISQSKAQEMKNLADAGISIPNTFFGSLSEIRTKAPNIVGFPIVVKSTSGKKGREVYSAKNREELKKLIEGLMIEEKSGKKFFAQEFINAVRRIRVMVIGGSIVGAIQQLTKWRKRVAGYEPSPDEKKIDKFDPDEDIKKLALSATLAVGLDIAGVDILIDEKSGRKLVIEVNAAPAWKLIKKYCEINVEYEIIKYLQGQI
jgi:RimK family alpha-L-glutamate ligase